MPVPIWNVHLHVLTTVSGKVVADITKRGYADDVLGKMKTGSSCTITLHLWGVWDGFNFDFSFEKARS